jgi:sugar phosphate isomerase/epimerase
MEKQHKLGACTWMFGELLLSEIARRLGKLGFDGVELMGSLDLYQPAEAARIRADHGLEILSLTPENVDLAHPEPAIHAEAVDYYLRLLDFGAALDGPLVCCHGDVGRIRVITSQEEEWAIFAGAVREVAERAQTLNLRLVIEVLNRYESHLANNAVEALAFVGDVGADNVGILLDAYHMNIEEPEPAGALRQAGDRLWLYHAADSNRQAIGRGHTDFDAQMAALDEINYSGPTILECTAPGPDPFKAIKDESSLGWLETYLAESRKWLSRARN